MSFVTTSINAQGIATVTLNNPQKHNAFDEQLIADLSHTFAQIDSNAEVRVMVLASAGKSFSSGADLSWMQRMANYSREQNLADSAALAAMFKQLNFMSKPTLARVQGAAFGGAIGLISCCDIALAVERASFSLSEVKIGLIPATISPYVIAAIGQRAARRYFTTGERFSAARALELGLISEVLADEQALDHRITELSDQWLSCGPLAVKAAKQLVFAMDRQINQALIDDSCQRIADIRVSDEGQEGLSAFLEKRKPSWLK